MGSPSGDRSAGGGWGTLGAVFSIAGGGVPNEQKRIISNWARFSCKPFSLRKPVQLDTALSGLTRPRPPDVGLSAFGPRPSVGKHERHRHRPLGSAGADRSRKSEEPRDRSSSEQRHG